MLVEGERDFANIHVERENSPQIRIWCGSIDARRNRSKIADSSGCGALGEKAGAADTISLGRPPPLRPTADVAIRRKMTSNAHILVDADACPVKEEIYKVAFRTGTPVTIVANQRIRVPDHELVKRAVVGDAMDAADDWISERANRNAVVVTADILLADRCIKAGAKVIAPNGKPFTEDSIGAAIATRAIMADLRAGATGDNIGGPAPFRKEDRSRFLSALDEALVKLRRDGT
jgi:uncharacterized protein YaiI (UPF0178 family)